VCCLVEIFISCLEPYASFVPVPLLFILRYFRFVNCYTYGVALFMLGCFLMLF
jgi:hypothetical protein